jgi:hypothetical protein
VHGVRAQLARFPLLPALFSGESDNEVLPFGKGNLRGEAFTLAFHRVLQPVHADENYLIFRQAVDFPMDLLHPGPGVAIAHF